MVFLNQQTLIYAVPLMIVALAGVCAERSGIINLGLEGIMIFSSFMGVIFVRVMQAQGWTQEQGQLIAILALFGAGLCGVVFSLLLAFSAINLKADQTIGGTALNMLAPAFAMFFIYMIAQQSSMGINGSSGSWFMLKSTDFGGPEGGFDSAIMNIFFNNVYITTYVCVLMFIIISIFLYKNKIGLRLRS